MNSQKLIIVGQERLLVEAKGLDEGVAPVLLASLLMSRLYLPVVFEFFFVQIRLILYLIAAKVINFQLLN